MSSPANPAEAKMARSSSRHFYARIPSNSGFFYSFNVENDVASSVEANPDFYIQQYTQDPRSFGGRYIAADLFKEAFEQYRQSKDARNRYNTPVHNSAAVLSAEQFRRVLTDTNHPERTDVVFLTGIPGAGKTSSVLSGGELPNSYRLIFEGQLSNLDATLQKLHQVLDAGLKPLIMVVHAKPEDALANTIPRFYEEGRGARIKLMESSFHFAIGGKS